MIPNIHDHTVYKYIVDYENKTLTFYTKLDRVKSEIKFNGLISHEFLNNINSCIIYDIEILDSDLFVNYYGLNNLRNRKEYGWPIDFENKNNFKKKLKDKNIKIYMINSSYGLSGYVFAKEINVSFH